ncbi:HAD family phosphatase [Candidatus Babeliales bacterium]|nr:HAD family phosphatase [Candidatus Babeliales bacterium]
MKSIKNTINAIIFDMDGTIIQSEHLWLDATKQLLINHGITKWNAKQEEFLDNLSGIGLTPCVVKMKKEFMLQASVEKLVKETKDLAIASFEDQVTMIEGFAPFHAKLREKGIKSSIATNADQKSLNVLSKMFKFDTFFGSHLYCVEHVEKPKPDPAIFLHAANQLGVKPSECVVFEDSVFGFRAAKAAGMRCIGVENSQNKHLLSEYTNASFSTYHDAMEALTKL